MRATSCFRRWRPPSSRAGAVPASSASPRCSWASAGDPAPNLAVTRLDPLLGGATQQAAQLLVDDAVVPVTANYYFMIASTFLVTVVGWLVTSS